MRPLVLISGLGTGGAERVTAAFLCRLAQEGRGVLLCTVTARHDGPLAVELREAGVRRVDLGARRLADPRAFMRLLHVLRREEVDVVHAHGQDASILAAAARRLGRIRLVVTRHVLDEPSENRRQRLRARASLAALQRADVPVAVSLAAARRLAELTPLPTRRIRVLRNGVELSLFGRPDVGIRRQEVRRALGLEPDEPVVLLPAVLRSGKGHDVLLDAAPELCARVPRARMLLAGDGELEEALRAHAAALGSAVRFLGRRDDIPDLLAACDLVVLPSRAEALPTALMEAAAAGRPAVATDVGGTAEVVVRGVTGLLVPPGDPAALTDAMAALLNDTGRARAMGEAARGHAAQHFGIDGQVRRTLALWDEVAEGGAQ